MTASTLELLDDDHWYSLVTTVCDGTCTLMLGPEAVTGDLHGEHLPVHVALAKHIKEQLPAELRDRLGGVYDRLDPWKPASVAQVVLREVDPTLVRRWVERFDEEFVIDDQPLRDLAALPFELVINTSPIDTVTNLFSATKPGTTTAYYDRTGKTLPMLPDVSQDRPLVYQLYGSFERPRSMILSDSDRLDLIVKVARGRPALPLNLSSALQDDDRSFLFLGFDLADWHFRALLHILSDDATRNYTSFAAELDSAPLDFETQDFYRTNHRIHFFSGDLAEFCTQLRSRCDIDEPVRSTVQVARPAAPAPGSPVVFICHASEDAAHAERIAHDLRTAGIDTWFDKENLRGGDRWDDMIERTIKRDVDYVVVLQSEAMKQKEVGYVNREIHLALARQHEYRAPRVFLIPAYVDGIDSKLDLIELDRLQSVDVTPSAGVTDLVRAIMRDLSLQGRLG